MGLVAVGLTQHLWSPRDERLANVPWKQGDWVAVDFCGRLLPLSKKLECYTQLERPHAVPPQEQVDLSMEDMFKRLLFDDRNITVVLVVDGRSNPLKHRFDKDGRQLELDKARQFLTKAAQARADMPEYQHFTVAEWGEMRDKIKAAQKTVAHYDATFFALVQNWIVRTKRAERVLLRVAAYESDPQVVHLLEHGYVDYVVADDSDIMCFPPGVRQWSGYLNCNKNVPRRHSILHSELKHALRSLGVPSASSSSSSLSSSSSSSSAAVPSPPHQLYSQEQLLPVLATVLGNDNFPWCLAYVCVCCPRGAHMMCAACARGLECTTEQPLIHRCIGPTPTPWFFELYSPPRAHFGATTQAYAATSGRCANVGAFHAAQPQHRPILHHARGVYVLCCSQGRGQVDRYPQEAWPQEG